jgi:hypothetical protein
MNTLKPLNPPGFGSAQAKSPQAKARNLSFLEALKDQARSATFGVAGAAIDQLTQKKQTRVPENQSQNTFNFEEFLRQREQHVRQQERMVAQRQRSSETLVFHAVEEKAKKEIELIQKDIKTLVVQTGKLSSELIEAEKTVATQVVDIKTGTYYVSFFERIRRLIKLAKKRITESRTWLEAFSSRNRAKGGYYWGQVQKSGTKFMLSQERYMATQAG